MKKLGCAKCGGQKMAKGGTKLAAAGIPYAVGAGQTDAKMGTMRKGGKVTTRKKMGMGGMHKMPDGTMMKDSMMKKGGSLKPVPADKVGLAKLPTAVRNKMGFQKNGGVVKKK